MDRRRDEIEKIHTAEFLRFIVARKINIDINEARNR
jgi:hypothetical protein